MCCLQDGLLVNSLLSEAHRVHNFGNTPSHTDGYSIRVILSLTPPSQSSPKSPTRAARRVSTSTAGRSLSRRRTALPGRRRLTRGRRSLNPLLNPAGPSIPRKGPRWPPGVRLRVRVFTYRFSPRRTRGPFMERTEGGRLLAVFMALLRLFGSLLVSDFSAGKTLRGATRG